MWMKASDIARALGVPLQRAYSVARRRWTIRVAPIGSFHVWEWDADVTPELVESERERAWNHQAQHYPNIYGHRCRHGRTATYHPCPQCVAFSRAIVAMVFEEVQADLPTGVPAWIFR